MTYHHTDHLQLLPPNLEEGCSIILLLWRNLSAEIGRPDSSTEIMIIRYKYCNNTLNCIMTQIEAQMWILTFVAILLRHAGNIIMSYQDVYKRQHFHGVGRGCCQGSSIAEMVQHKWNAP